MPKLNKKIFTQHHAILSDCVSINAPREYVWDILCDLHQYPDWNPFSYKVESTLNVGDPIDLYVKMEKRGLRQQRETVCIVNKPVQLSWNMKLGAASILQAQRDQWLTATGEQQCTYQTSDTFSGLLTPVVLALFESDIKTGFNAVAYALKQRTEMLWQNKEGKN